MRNYGGWICFASLVLGGCVTRSTDVVTSNYDEKGAPSTSSSSKVGAVHAQSVAKNAATLGPASIRLAGFPAAPASGSMNWSATHGGAGDDVAFAVAADDASDAIVAGAIEGDVDLGCGMHSTASRAGFVAQYAPDGTCTWAVYFDGADDASASAVAFDSVTHDVYVTGIFDESVSIGGNVVQSAGGYDAFVARVSGGVVTWSTTFGGASDEYVYALAVDGTHVGVGGAFYDRSSFGGESSATSQGDADAFVATYLESSGDYAASWTAGGTSWDAVNALAASSTGFVAAGTFADGVDFGRGVVQSAGGQDAFLVSLDSNLAATSSRVIAGAGDDSLAGVFVDASGNVTTSGYFQGAASVGAADPVTADGDVAGLVATYDSSLTYIRSSTFAASGEAVVQALAADPSTGGFLLAGRFSGTASVANADYASDENAESGFVLAYAPDGSVTWGGVLGSGQAAEGLSIAVSPSGHVVAVGDFETSVDFGDGPVASAGQGDVFVLSLHE
ncbi:MAG: hypothetical protein ACRELY_28135 [Polyangiaceae bacterium]